MHRLVGVRLHYQNVWRDNKNKQWRDQGAFGILESFSFRDSRSVGSLGSYEERHSTFRWGSVLFDSFANGYLKGIDYGLVRELAPGARRLYRYLDKHFHPPKKVQVRLDLGRLAYQHIGVSPNVKINKVRSDYIIPAAEALIEAGYLQGYRFEDVRRGCCSVVFQLAHKKSAVEKAIEKRSVQPQSALLLQALGKQGVETAKGLTFLAEFSQPEIEQALLAMQEQTHKGVKIRFPSRWMEKALRQGFRATAETQRSSKRPELKVFKATRRAS
jgi:hypothetical protein